MEKVTLYPSKKFKKELEYMAKKDNRSLNNFIISILTKYYKCGRK